MAVFPAIPWTPGWLRDYAPKSDFLMVGSDNLRDTEATIDFCLQVRRAVPALPLVLVSNEIRSHDFRCDRMMACDVTLKAPVLHISLTVVIQAAFLNMSIVRRAGDFGTEIEAADYINKK